MECKLFKGIGHAGQITKLKEDTWCEIIRADNLPYERYFVFNEELGIEFCLTREQVRTDVAFGGKIIEAFDNANNYEYSLNWHFFLTDQPLEKRHSNDV